VGGLYLYSNQMGCDGDRLYFDGSAIISLNGHLLSQSPQFSVKEVEVIVATVDLDLIQILRGNRPSYTNQSARANQLFPFQYTRINVSDVKLCHYNLLEIPVINGEIEPFYHAQEREIGLGPALWMWDYLRKCGAGGFYIPLSGGLDSCSCALIVYTMAHFLAENSKIPQVRKDLIRVLGLRDSSEKDIDAIICDAKQLTNRLLYTCYLGTENSSESSRLRAENLAKTINSYGTC
jgi:NAD+ synthase (glutamine-hydrolysing)